MIFVRWSKSIDFTIYPDVSSIYNLRSTLNESCNQIFFSKVILLNNIRVYDVYDIYIYRHVIIKCTAKVDLYWIFSSSIKKYWI